MRIILSFFTAGLFFLSAAAQDGLKTGDKFPEFTAKDDQGNTWSSKDYVGEKVIIAFFYPAAMTGGCTRQACSYRDDYSKFEALDAVVVGISGDEVEGLALFKKAHDLNFPLLSDKDGSIAGKFGVPLNDGGSIEREIDGNTYRLNRGVTASRWTFIADKDGDIRYINRSVDAAGDSRNVLDVLAELNIK